MKASRLLDLLLVLQTRQRIGTAELAERFEVSRRTILRDIDALSAAGVPVYAERGRFGGIVLLPGARLNASYLEPAELESLSIAGLDSRQLGRLGLASAYERAQLKMAAKRTGNPGGEPNPTSLAELVYVENSGWMDNSPPGVDVANLAFDLRTRCRLRISYRRSKDNEASTRIVDPYGLAAKAGRWYLVADHETLPRLFSVQRLEGYDVMPEPATIRPGSTLRSVWEDLKKRTEDPGGVRITARLRASRLDLARRILGSRLEGSSPMETGWCLITVRYPEIESVRQLLQFADHLEVLTPIVARERLAELAANVAHRHSGPSASYS